MSKLIVGLSLFLSVVSLHAEDQNDAVIKQWESLSQKIKGATTGSACTSLDTSKCTAPNFCENLRSSRNNLYVYQNSEGQKIPNYQLISLNNKVESCLIQARAAKPQTDQTDSFKKMTESMAKNEMALLTVVQANHEEAKFLKIKQAMLEDTIKKKQSAGFLGLSEEQQKNTLKVSIATAEKKTGVRLSEKTKQAWLNTIQVISVSHHDEQESSLSKDPFIDAKYLTEVKAAGSKQNVLKNQKLVQARFDKNYQIFGEVQKRLISLLEKRKNGTNEKQIDSMISRIKLIRLDAPSMADQSMGACRSPNAFYNPSNHKFVMCRQVMNYPDENLKMIIAHELGHSIDPCTATEPLASVEVEEQKIQSMKFPEYKNDLIVPFQFKVPDQGKGKFTAQNKSWFEADNAPQKVKFADVAPAVPLKENPFSSVVECLASRESVNARTADLETVKKNLKDQIAKYKASQDPIGQAKAKELEGTLSRIDTTWENRKACSILPGKSEMQEAFSDWLASQLVSEDVENAAKKSQAEAQKLAFESQGFFLSFGCFSSVPDLAADVKTQAKKSGCGYEKSEYIKDLSAIYNAESKDEHPDMERRVEKIMLANPKVRAALGCSVANGSSGGVKSCE